MWGELMWAESYMNGGPVSVLFPVAMKRNSDKINLREKGVDPAYDSSEVFAPTDHWGIQECYTYRIVFSMEKM